MLGVVGVDGKVSSAGSFIFEKDVIPGLAAVSGAEDAALGAGAPGMAQGGNIHKIGVGGVDTDAGDVPGVL